MKQSLKFAIASGALLSGASTYSEAQIVYFDFSGDPSATGKTVLFDAGGDTPEPTSGLIPGRQFDLGPVGGGYYAVRSIPPLNAPPPNEGPPTSPYKVLSTEIGGFHYATKLTLGTSIGSSPVPGAAFISSIDLEYSYITGPLSLFPNDGSKGYIGLEVPDPNNSNLLDYGWAQISVNPDGTMTLYGVAFQTTASTPILAGDTGIAAPEPSTTGLLLFAGGALALAARRRRLETAKRVA